MFPCSCLEDGSKADLPQKADAKQLEKEKNENGKRRGGRLKLVVPPKLLMAIEKDRTLKERLRKYNLPIKGTRQVRGSCPEPSTDLIAETRPYQSSFGYTLKCCPSSLLVACKAYLFQ